MIEVESSNIESIGYDAATKDLCVKFKGNTTYVYDGVPLTIYQNLMSAGSKGKFFAEHIKKSFTYRKV